MRHHLSPDLRVKGLAEIHRVLKPGGRLLIADTMQPRGFFVNRQQLFCFLADASSYKSISAQRNLYLMTKSRCAAMLNIESS